MKRREELRTLRGWGVAASDLAKVDERAHRDWKMARLRPGSVGRVMDPLEEGVRKQRVRVWGQKPGHWSAWYRYTGKGDWGAVPDVGVGGRRVVLGAERSQACGADFGRRAASLEKEGAGMPLGFREGVSWCDGGLRRRVRQGPGARYPEHRGRRVAAWLAPLATREGLREALAAAGEPGVAEAA